MRGFAPKNGRRLITFKLRPFLSLSERAGNGRKAVSAAKKGGRSAAEISLIGRTGQAIRAFRIELVWFIGLAATCYGVDDGGLAGCTISRTVVGTGRRTG